MGENKTVNFSETLELLKPTVRKPYIGLTVHYHDHYKHTRAAIITAVHQDEQTCDLCILYPSRLEFLLGVKHDTDHEKETWDFIY